MKSEDLVRSFAMGAIGKQSEAVAVVYSNPNLVASASAPLLETLPDLRDGEADEGEH